ncbi:MAG: 16S rRNA (adenine(1518)-N(6)/adenine(1519)-N(6))-dimethyltransferase RsmA [Candidatus Paceibacterota bacterium]
MIHKAKKSLGQNFLKSELALKKIIEAGEIKPEDIILEIGPGKGALTEKLFEHSNKIIAVEKDRKLYEFLKEKFSLQIKSGALSLLNQDILDLNIKNEYKIIANIPYNITGAILKKFLTAKYQPECMVLMVQHEVAKRIIARDKKESILSISVKAYGEPKIIMKVPARYFSPAPKVDSAIIKINNISRKIFEENKVNEEKFWEIVKTGFAHKRKKLSSNLKKIDNISVENLKNKRAEDLNLLDWFNLAKN